VTGFSPSTSVSPVSIFPPVLHTHLPPPPHTHAFMACAVTTLCLRFQRYSTQSNKTHHRAPANLYLACSSISGLANIFDTVIFITSFCTWATPCLPQLGVSIPQTGNTALHSLPVTKDTTDYLFSHHCSPATERSPTDGRLTTVELPPLCPRLCSLLAKVTTASVPAIAVTKCLSHNGGAGR
jgi:hypothetical protein